VSDRLLGPVDPVVGYPGRPAKPPAFRALPDPNATVMFFQQREVIRAAARDAGRPDVDLPVVVRANLLAGTSVAEGVEALLAFTAATGVTEVFVDAAPLASTVDELLDVVGQFLAAAS
jgi:hypothetical protein